MPLVSVVVPIYKVEPYLRRCVDSILNQTFSDFDLILVDDGSPDNCGKICDEYAKQDSRITVIHRANGGLSAARNSGIDWSLENSNSEWITFIDSDDWVLPNYLEVLYNLAVENDVKISCCDSLHITHEKTSIPKIDVLVQNLNKVDFFLKYNDCANIAWLKLYYKGLLKNIRFPVGRLFEDTFTTHKILFLANHIVYTNQKLYCYYFRDDSIMRSTWSDKKTIDAIESREEQCFFFKEYKNKQIKKFLFCQYYYTLNSIFKRIERDESSYSKYDLFNKIGDFAKKYYGFSTLNSHKFGKIYWCYLVTKVKCIIYFEAFKSKFKK